METIATLFSAILLGMRAALAPHVDRDPARTPFLLLAWTRLGRAATRFQSLFTRWQSGTLPAPIKPRAGQPRAARARPYFPAGRAWLAGSTDHHVRGRASQLEHLLAHPDMLAFLAAAPQAGRILRPLCHMLGIDPPAMLRLPPRPVCVRPKPPRAARLAPQPLARPLPAYVRAAVRAWRKRPA